MQKVRKVLDFFHRFRFVFLGIIIAITAPLITLSVAKGSVTSVSKFEISYTYGEEITYSGSAFMGETSFEFRKKGETVWQEEAPKYVGEYEVRAKCKGNYGYKYSSVYSFAIDPLEVSISIKNDHINYGDDHPALTYELLGGDTLNSDYTVNYADLTKNTTTALLDTSTLKVHNKDNEDITDCYAFTTEEKEITFNKSVINIKFADDFSTTYDGNGYTNDNWEHTSGNLYYGAQIVVDPGLTATEIGTYHNEHIVRVMKDGVDYSENYDIQVNDNSIRIDKAPGITITTNSLSKVYDGKPFELKEETSEVLTNGTVKNGEFSVTVTGLLPIHHAEVVFTNTEQKNVISGIKNELNYRILDEEGNDVEDHYQSVSVSKGDMSISLRPVTYTTEDDQFIYDGKEHSKIKANKDYEPTNGSLAENEYVELQDNYTKCVAVGSEDNVQEFKIFHKVGDEEPFEVTSNYDLTVIYGRLDILSRQITVASANLNEQFDNQEKSQTSYTYKETDLAEGDYISLESYTTQTSPTENADNEHQYKIYHRNESGEDQDVTEYYDINKVTGKITVFTKPLEFAFEKNDITYDGQDHNYYKNNNTASLKDEFKNNLPKGFSYSVTLVPQDPNEKQDKYQKMNAYQESGYTADEKDVVVQIFDAKGVDVTEFYEENELKVDIPTSKVSKKDATISLENEYEKTFDNKTLEDTIIVDQFKVGTKASAEGLITGHYLNVEYNDQSDSTDNPKNKKYVEEDENTHKEKSHNVAFTYTILDNQGENVGSNYDISIDDQTTQNQDGTLSLSAKINKRKLFLEADNIEKTYDEKNTFEPKIKKMKTSKIDGYDCYEGSIGEEEKKTVEKVVINPEKIQAGAYTTQPNPNIAEADGSETTRDDGYKYTYNLNDLDIGDIKVYIEDEDYNDIDVTSNYEFDEVHLLNAGEITIKRRGVSVLNNIKNTTVGNLFIYRDDNNKPLLDINNYQNIYYDDQNHGAFSWQKYVHVYNENGEFDHDELVFVPVYNENGEIDYLRPVYEYSNEIFITEQYDFDDDEKGIHDHSGMLDGHYMVFNYDYDPLLPYEKNKVRDAGEYVNYDDENYSTSTYDGYAYYSETGKDRFGTKIYNARSKDVTTNYGIHHEDMKFQIVKPTIEIVSQDVKRQFDCEKFDIKQYDTLNFGDYNDYKSFDNGFTGYSSLNEYDYQDLYHVTFSDYGCLKTYGKKAETPLKPYHHLVITKYDEESAKKAYDYGYLYGYDFKCRVLDFTDLIPNDDADDLNLITPKLIERALQDPLRDVTDCYNINPVKAGRLSVDPVKLTVGCIDKSIPYDSKVHSIDEIQGLGQWGWDKDGFYCDLYEDIKDPSCKFEENFRSSLLYNSCGAYGTSYLYLASEYEFRPTLNLFMFGDEEVFKESEHPDHLYATDVDQSYDHDGIKLMWGNTSLAYTITPITITLAELTIGGKTMRYIAGGKLQGSDYIMFNGTEALYDRQWHTYTSALNTARVYRNGKDVTDICYSIIGI